MSSDHRIILILAAIFGIIGFLLSKTMFSDSTSLESKPAPISRFALMDGSQFVLRKSSRKPVIINVWATWCPPCIKEMPMLDAVHRSGRARVLAIASDERDAVERFLKQNDFDMAIAMVEDVPNFEQAFKLPNMLPFTIFIDSKGMVMGSKRGMMSRSDVDQMLKKAGY